MNKTLLQSFLFVNYVTACVEKPMRQTPCENGFLVPRKDIKATELLGWTWAQAQDTKLTLQDWLLVSALRADRW